VLCALNFGKHKIQAGFAVEMLAALCAKPACYQVSGTGKPRARNHGREGKSTGGELLAAIAVTYQGE
jgi:hypothetical protein